MSVYQARNSDLSILRSILTEMLQGKQNCCSHLTEQGTEPQRG